MTVSENAVEENVRLFTAMQGAMQRAPDTLFWEGTPRPLPEFRRIMAEERRLSYQLPVTRVYGLY